MADDWYVGTYGRGHHKESPEVCARRALTFLSALRQLEPCFEQFQYSRRVRGKMVTEDLVLDLDKLSELFARGVIRNNTDRAVMEELGFTIDISTPGKNGASLSIHLGAYGPGTYNSCELHLPVVDPEAARAVTLSMLTRILRHMVDAFDPDTGLASYYEFQESLKDPVESLDRLQTGWIMYFSNRKGRIPPLPAPVRIEPVGEQGHLIVLTDERVSAAVPEHVQLGRQVRKLLIKSGLGDKLPGEGD